MEIKNAVAVVLLIFLKDNNGLCGRAISSSQLANWQVDSTVYDFHNSWYLQEVIHDMIILKGCVHCIFASLFLGLNESTCQIRKTVFYFTSKPLFVLEKIKF